MQYMIIKSNDIQVVVNRVNKYIKEGWIPQGGVCISRVNTILINYYMENQYAQAMIYNNGVCDIQTLH